MCFLIDRVLGDFYGDSEDLFAFLLESTHEDIKSAREPEANWNRTNI